MYVKLQPAIQKYNLKISGVIHAGAHFGEEYETYKQCGIEKIMFFEPCKPAFAELVRLFENHDDVLIFQFALGDEMKNAVMNIETVNTGQSNSLLKPALHLKQFPSITFNDTAEVKVSPLDYFEEQISAFPYNMLYMDVQGYEDRVLRGAVNTLKQIDVVYTEVNTDEVYEGCARMTELDSILSDFVRVETNLAGGNWGDALYIRKTLLNTAL